MMRAKSDSSNISRPFVDKEKCYVAILEIFPFNECESHTQCAKCDIISVKKPQTTVTHKRK